MARHSNETRRRKLIDRFRLKFSPKNILENKSVEYETWTPAIEVPYQKPAYTYTPLSGFDELRVLTIQPGTSGLVYCKLSNVNFAKNPGYEALSYVRGDEHAVHEIEINGGTFHVAENLFAALKHLRRPSQTVIVWIDALCINHQDEDERGKQIGLMGKIYLNALGVLVWLGTPVAGDRQAVQIIEKFDDASGRVVNWNELDAEAVLGGTKREASLKALASLLQRPWFRRTWVIQEVVLATKTVILCGHHITSWSALCRFADWLKCHDTLRFDASILSRLDVMRHLRWLVRHTKRERGLTLFKLLSTTKQFDATNPHDKIFGMMGLGDFSNTDGIVVTYNSCQDLYTNYAKRTMESGLLWDVLSEAGIDLGATNLKLPSWVPDWSIISSQSPTSKRVAHFSSWYRAAGDTQRDFKFLDSNQTLSITGFVFDTIASIVEPMHAGEPESESDSVEAKHASARTARDIMAQICHETDESIQYPSGQHWDLVWAQLFVCSQKMIGMRKYLSSKASDEWFLAGCHGYTLRLENLDASARGAVASEVQDELDATEEAALEYEGVSRAVLTGRRGARTEGGYLGWVPKTALPGDLICVFDGARLPYVVREREAGRCVLVGECYIHGVMEGEVAEEGQDTRETFLIV
ncbi:heterokaryon incompatibility protein-domain-containing protein [Amylocarpus encephaloides]|uniref:Heterokaryon incompatibility protein-domain-containing protein n=1 Tax=Amylocarpus encephaloides TaxID=45428 RepID=A0A9P8C4G7_9HELO|nr:heterokaryon incompatibility protein-domain-containing protein [Amylocarpus encephaloides]